MKTLTAVLLVIAVADAAAAEELRLTAADILRHGSIRWGRPSADGKGIELDRGILVENDGAAAGYSYKPNEEKLNDAITAFQKFQLKFPFQLKLLDTGDRDEKSAPPKRAFLLVGHTGKLRRAIINGEEVKLPPPTAAGNYWNRYEIPASFLKEGVNELGVQGEGKLWIAREEERSHRRTPMDKGPHSYKIVAGKISKLLGPKDDIAGEYYIRLYLDGYSDTGLVNTPIYDAANLSGEVIPPPNVRVKRIKIKLHANAAKDGIDAGIHWATNRQRTAFRGLSSVESDFEVDDSERELPRFFQAESWLRPATFETTPQLTGMQIQTEIAADEGWGQKLKIVARNVPNLRHWDGGEFHFEDLEHPKLAEFRKEFTLEEVVKGCKTDLERMQRLAVWTSQQWTKGHLKDIYPKWDACEILKKHPDGTPVGGFCQQFNIVFLQACEAFGMPGRCVSIGAGDHGVKIRSGHEVVEIWSNELNKWVYVDGQAAWYFVDKETREPLNLLELRERQLAVLLDKPQRAESKRPVEVVVLAKSPYEWKGLQEWPAFTELRMIPHTQFLDGELPLPLNQGMRGWFWTGHRVWTDDLYPASVLYSNRVTNTNDWNFPINQTQIWLQQNTKVGDLDVRVENNMPSFEKYEIQFDDQPPRFEAKAEFQWPLHAGENRLQVRAVNKLGLRGPASWFQVQYKE